MRRDIVGREIASTNRPKGTNARPSGARMGSVLRRGRLASKDHRNQYGGEAEMKMGWARVFHPWVSDRCSLSVVVDAP